MPRSTAARPNTSRLRPSGSSADPSDQCEGPSAAIAARRRRLTGGPCACAVRLQGRPASRRGRSPGGQHLEILRLAAAAGLQVLEGVGGEADAVRGDWAMPRIAAGGSMPTRSMTVGTMSMMYIDLTETAVHPPESRSARTASPTSAPRSPAWPAVACTRPSSRQSGARRRPEPDVRAARAARDLSEPQVGGAGRRRGRGSGRGWTGCPRGSSRLGRRVPSPRSACRGAAGRRRRSPW